MREIAMRAVVLLNMTVLLMTVVVASAGCSHTQQPE
jgi:hypothetical protein